MKKYMYIVLVMVLAAILFTTFSNRATQDTALAEENIASGIYEVANDVYHDTEIGMSMARSYLNDTMTVKITKDEVLYTIGFSGTDYMENYRIKVNDLEVPVEIVDEDTEAGTITLQVATTSLDDQLKACIYVGPMERDVEFGIIPNLATMSLVEAIEEEAVVEETAEEETMEDVQDNETVYAKEDSKTEEKGIGKGILFAGAAILVVIIAGTIVIKRKK